MSHFRPFTAFGFLLCGLMSLSLTGCETSDSISSYAVPKHELQQTSEFLAANERRHPKPERMIGVVIPKNNTLWFLKLQGPVAAVAARENDVETFVKSLRFNASGQMEWTLPPGWQELPVVEPGGLRQATLRLDGEPALEISVTKFPSRIELSVVQQVVPNINRWRGQLSLPSIEEDDLPSQSKKLIVDGVEAYLVSISGRPNAKPMGMPFAPAANAEPQAGSDKPQEPSSSPVRFDKPDEWNGAPPAMFSVASFAIKDGTNTGGTVSITPAQGDQLSNVNRWRGQMGFEPLKASELAGAAKDLPVGTMIGKLYEIVGPERSIFGVIVEREGQTWFVKLTGSNALATRERSRFVAFVKSLRWD